MTRQLLPYGKGGGFNRSAHSAGPEKQKREEDRGKREDERGKRKGEAGRVRREDVGGKGEEGKREDGKKEIWPKWGPS